MNKDLLEQIPAEEQPIASKLNSFVDDMQLSQAFQWELETQLMDKANATAQPVQSWFTKIMIPVGWAILAVCAILLLNWTIRSIVPSLPPAAEPTPTQEASFENSVRQGNICADPLAVAHNFSVFVTNQNKTGFMMFDESKTIGELRAFAWSPDGRQLAIVGNTTGRGNIYLTHSTGSPLQPVLANSELGYLMGTSWSQNGNLLLAWSVQNNQIVYLLNPNGTGLVKRDLPVQIFETPQFTPGQESIAFYGADSSLGDGLFQTMLNSSRTTNSSGIRIISDLVEDEGSFAWSPTGLQSAYVEMDRILGEARLVIEERTTNSKVTIASLPIPKGSGSSIPSSGNLSWSPDGKSIVFDFGRGASDRAIYLARADGTGLMKVVDSGYAPSVSSDGKCLAYINNKQVFLMDLTSIASHPTKAIPVLMADLPEGRSIADFRLDKLQWRP